MPKKLKSKIKVKIYKCDECGEDTINESGMCDKCQESDDGAPPDWEFDAYGDRCWGE